MSQQKRFTFGQIVYILPNKPDKIYPAIIREEIVTRSMDGEKVSYIVQMGPQGQAKQINLEKVNGDVYGTMEEIKERLDLELQDLIQRFNNNVEKLCEDANNTATKWYGEQLQQLGTNIADSSKIDPAVLIAGNTSQQNQIVFGSQQQMQQPLMPLSNNPQDQQQALRQTLIQRVALPEEIQGDVLVQMPDGRMLPARQGNGR